MSEAYPKSREAIPTSEKDNSSRNAGRLRKMGSSVTGLFAKRPGYVVDAADWPRSSHPLDMSFEEILDALDEITPEQWAEGAKVKIVPESEDSR